MSDPIEENKIEEIKEPTTPKGHSKKYYAEVTTNYALVGFSVATSFFLTAIYIANMGLMAKNDLSGLMLIFTLPLFLFMFIINLFCCLPAFFLSLGAAISSKFKDTNRIILFILSTLVTIYPFVLFAFIVLVPSAKNAINNSSSEQIESNISAIINLI